MSIPGALAESTTRSVTRRCCSRTRGAASRARRAADAIVAGPSRKFEPLQRLVGTSRAIVTEVPGTTRDLVTEIVDLDGLRVTLVDTAGIRETEDIVESEGVARTRQAADVSDLILLVVDGSQPLEREDQEEIVQTADNKQLIVSNKSDMPVAWSRKDAICVSAKTGRGIELLRRRIVEALRLACPPMPRDHYVGTSTRAARPDAFVRAGRRVRRDVRCRRNLCLPSSRGACGARRCHRETIFG